MSKQFDLLRNAPQALAASYREAAEAARINPFETPEQSERRVEHYLREAERLERGE